MSLDRLFSVLSSELSSLSAASDFSLWAFFSFDGDRSGEAVLFLSFDLSRDRSGDLERRSLDLERRPLLRSLSRYQE